MIPMMYDYKNQIESRHSPGTVHASNTVLVRFLERYLLQKVISRFEWEGLKDDWASDYFYYTLYCFGFIAILDTKEFGVIPQNCTLQGYDVFYRPYGAVVTNPLLPDYHELKIGVNCALIKMQPDYGGVMDAVSTYADMMALAMESAGVNLVNSKLAYVFMSKNKTAAESFKKMFDQISKGNPAAFLDKDLFDEEGNPAWLMFNQNLQQNYIAGALMEDVKKIEAQFNSLIGIPNVNIAKESGVSADEVNANNVDTFSHADLWLATMQEGCRKANELFGLNLSVKLRDIGGGEGVGYDVNSGAVPVQSENL